MRSGLVIAALLAIHLILAFLQSTHLLPAEPRWFEDRVRREEWRDALAQRHVARLRRDIRRWMESPDPKAGALPLAHSLDEAHSGLSPSPVRWDEEYAALSTALAAFVRSPDDANHAAARRACREADKAMEEIGDRLSR
jgi:hypothetical protein